jgi:hypothetical protein
LGILATVNQGGTGILSHVASTSRKWIQEAGCVCTYETRVFGWTACDALKTVEPKFNVKVGFRIQAFRENILLSDTVAILCT